MSGRWWGLVAISLGVALIIVDATIVNVAIPSLITDLGISSSQALWVQESYAVVFAALLPVAGRLADSLGSRRVFLAGIATFMAASVAAASAPSGEVLIVARLLQGLGGAAILPTSLSLINAGFRGRERGQAFAIWGSTIGAAAALGPLLGGWLTTDFSWRWAFGINLPLGVLVALGVLTFVRAPAPAGRTGADPLGAALSVIAAGSLAFGLIEGRTSGWWTATRPVDLAGLTWTSGPSPVPFSLGLAVLAAIAFVALQARHRRRGRPGLLDLHLFSIRSFAAGNVAAAIISMGEFGLLFALPLWLQNVLGFTAFTTGLALLPLALGSFAASGAGAAIGTHIGPLSMVRLGLGAEIVGVAGLGAVALTLGTGTPWWALTPLLFVYGVGVGFATAQITNVVLAEVPLERSGQASGTQSTARQLGSALGIAILGTVLFSVLSTTLRADLATMGLPAEVATRFSATVTDTAGTAIAPLTADPTTRAAGEAAASAFSHATGIAALVAAGALVLGLLATRRLRPDLRGTAADEADVTAVATPEVTR